MQSVNLSDIRTDGGTQMRASLNDDTVSDYAAIIRDGVDFPPVILFFDGSTHWLADGFHRFFAYKQAGAVEIPAEVQQGTKREAILFSVGANAAHGLPRTREDKRKAVQALLDDAEWALWSDREIAKRAGVHHQLVANLRSSLDDHPVSRNYTTRHGTTATMDTGNIGKPQSEKEAEREDRKAQVEAAERQRADNLAQLPADVRERMSATEAAIADRAAAKGETLGAPPEDRIAELEAKVESLELEMSEKDERLAALARLEEMETLFAEGGVDALLAAKDRVIESKDAMIRTQGESLEKWKNECLSLRKRLNIEAPATSTIIDMQTGDVRHVAR